MGKLMRPTAKRHAEIVARYEDDLRNERNSHAECMEAKDTDITAMKADIEKIEASRDTACDITAEHLEKIEELERILDGTQNALELAVFELESYQSLLVTMVHESAIRRLRAKKLGTEGEVKA